MSVDKRDRRWLRALVVIGVGVGSMAAISSGLPVFMKKPPAPTAKLAAELAAAAKAKGGIKDPGEANVLIGMAQIAQGKYDAGIATLGQVSGSPARMRTAHLWTIYAQAKQKSGAAPAH